MQLKELLLALYIGTRPAAKAQAGKETTLSQTTIHVCPAIKPRTMGAKSASI
jgi:hypothetical protein